jgi:hypothetical protein
VETHDRFIGGFSQLKLAQCARCNDVFTRVRSAVCPACQDAEDADFLKIRDVVDRFPNLNAEQAAERAEVTVDCVLRMLDEGLITNAGVGSLAKCGRCGAPAISAAKRLCQACLLKLDADFSKAVAASRLNKRRLDEAEATEVRKILMRKRGETEPKRG